jgi:hypothetical protein
MCYNGFVKLARFLRALRTMRPRHAVLLTPSETAGSPRSELNEPAKVLSSKNGEPVTSLESTLVEVFIPDNLNLFRMNTYEKQGEWPPFAQFWCIVSPFRMNTCKSVSKQTTLIPFRMNTYEKQAGWGVSLLTRFPIRKSVLRSIATKDLSSHPIRKSVLRSIATKDLSSHPIRKSVLRNIATIDLSRPCREDSDPVGKNLSCYPAGKLLPSRQFRPQGS